MTIAYERQELRALALRPIPELPAYSDDYNVACRVGKEVAKHSTAPPRWDAMMQMALELSLRRVKPFSK